MEKVTMFYMEGCPYCRAALQWMDELFARYPQFREVELEKIDENKNPQLAAQYDYYYVPTYYVGRKKVHEGALPLKSERTCCAGTGRIAVSSSARVLPALQEDCAGEKPRAGMRLCRGEAQGGSMPVLRLSLWVCLCLTREGHRFRSLCAATA